ncbi:hypothetical protein CRENPOLYSF1_1120017 [Crenothrix polyspora]|uniref:Uncharacterized protein n=1 Tax=Crenothrix polyspora TaxID=360316 RepID=A0A1R4GZU5_9GAMM|nr:hypothetical protein CRENPOLYSF1_1120017 [Crenothrix polyspora]
MNSPHFIFLSQLLSSIRVIYIFDARKFQKLNESVNPMYPGE